MQKSEAVNTWQTTMETLADAVGVDLPSKAFKLNIEQFKEDLKTKTLSVVFTKVDGTKSVMTATLDPTIVPPQSSTKTAERKVVAEDVIRVWSVDRSGWRTLKANSISTVLPA